MNYNQQKLFFRVMKDDEKYTNTGSYLMVRERVCPEGYYLG